MVSSQPPAANSPQGQLQYERQHFTAELEKTESCSKMLLTEIIGPLRWKRAGALVAEEAPTVGCRYEPIRPMCDLLT
jgi:hypothetical protein